MNILSELYYGNIHPWDDPVPTDGEMGELTRKAIKAEHRFYASLTEEQQALYKVWEALEMERCSQVAEIAFLRALRLGARLMLAMLEE